MAKVVMLGNQDGTIHQPAIDCPGCHCFHVFDERWSFNGDMEKPTFKPSMLVNAHMPINPPHTHRCHSFVTDGRIQFLSDCSHDLAGQTIDLPDIED
ncbi:MAG: DUF6527 family protein [Desulfitobacterium sp.]